jgi:hypothetical protein
VPIPDRTVSVRIFAATLLAALAAFMLAPPLTAPAQANIGPIPTPCDLPGGDLVCDAVGNIAGSVAQATGDYIMRGVTSWVTDAAVWVTGKVGSLIDATASPDVQAGWFQGQYRTMLTVAGALALPMLLLALIQAVLRQDMWILLRSAFGYLPMAFILAGAAIVATQLLISIADDLSGMVVQSIGGTSNNLLQSVGDAYKNALGDNSDNAVPLFGIFLGAIILAVGAFVLWLELIIRDAAIYIALFFIPLTFVAMIWPATSRWARRLVELLVAVILAKFVIVSIISLATAAITNTTLVQAGDGNEFERMIAGSALLVLAAWSPFALLRLIPMMEVAAATVGSQRSSISNAAGSAGVQTPAAYMRQAMDRHSRPSTSATSAGAPRTAYMGGTAAPDAGGQPASGGRSTARETTSVRSDAPTEGRSRATYAPSAGSTPPGATATQPERAAPAEGVHTSPQPPPSPQRSTPPDPPRQTRPPRPPSEDA